MTSQKFIEAVRQQHASLKEIWTWPPFVEASPPLLGMTRIFTGHFYERLFAGHPEVRGLGKISGTSRDGIRADAP
jgi:hypothetical protein